MGIAQLRRHLLPLSRPVFLQSYTTSEYEGLELVKSVVVDGPSLVYNVYARLLSCFSATDCNILDALPTCDEVSRGFMTYLLCLEMLGVDMYEFACLRIYSPSTDLP